MMHQEAESGCSLKERGAFVEPRASTDKKHSTSKGAGVRLPNEPSSNKSKQNHSQLHMMSARNPGVKSISINLNSQSEYHSSPRKKEPSHASSRKKRITSQNSDQIKKLNAGPRKAGVNKEIRSIQSKGLASSHSQQSVNVFHVPVSMDTSKASNRQVEESKQQEVY